MGGSWIWIWIWKRFDFWLLRCACLRVLLILSLLVWECQPFSFPSLGVGLVLVHCVLVTLKLSYKLRVN